MTRRGWSSIVAALLFVTGCAGFSKLTSHDPNVTEAEVAAAGRSADVRFTEPLHWIVMNRASYETAVLVAAIVALGERRDPTAVEPLYSLREDPREEVRWQMTRSLAAIGGESAMRALEKIAVEDPSDLVREEAASTSN